MYILAGTFHIQPSEIYNMDMEEFREWVQAADEINREMKNGVNI